MVWNILIVIVKTSIGYWVNSCGVVCVFVLYRKIYIIDFTVGWIFCIHNYVCTVPTMRLGQYTWCASSNRSISGGSIEGRSGMTKQRCFFVSVIDNNIMYMTKLLLLMLVVVVWLVWIAVPTILTIVYTTPHHHLWHGRRPHKRRWRDYWGQVHITLWYNSTIGRCQWGETNGGLRTSMRRRGWGLQTGTHRGG